MVDQLCISIFFSLKLNVHATEGSQFLDCVSRKKFSDGSLGARLGEPHSH